MTARNRVWLARRNLPLPLVPVYLGTWILLTVARTRSAAGLRAWAAGFAEGMRTDVRRTEADALAHGVADDAPGPPADHLTAAGPAVRHHHGIGVPDEAERGSNGTSGTASPPRPVAADQAGDPAASRSAQAASSGQARGNQEYAPPSPACTAARRDPARCRCRVPPRTRRRPSHAAAASSAR